MFGQIERLLFINWIVCALTANYKRYSSVQTIIIIIVISRKSHFKSFESKLIIHQFHREQINVVESRRVIQFGINYNRIVIVSFFLTYTIINLPLADSAVWNYRVLLEIANVFGTCLLAIVWTGRYS